MNVEDVMTPGEDVVTVEIPGTRDDVLEYLQELGYISIETIGGPLLYGHITITKTGLEKYRELSQ